MGSAGAWTALVHLAREGFAASRRDCAEGDAFTSWRDRRIHVRRDAPAHAITALAHQLGHVLLHGEIAYLDRSGTVPCDGIRKVEADSIAILVAIYLGIDGPAITFPHISSWAGTDPRAHPAATVQAVASRVLGAGAHITAHLDAALPEAGPATQPVHAPGASEPEPPARIHVRAAAADPAGTPSLTAPGGELAQVHQTAARFFRCRLPGSWVPGYLASRGFDAAVQQRWQAGYAPAGWTTLIRHLRSLGYRDAVIEAAGLARRSWRGTLIDTFRDRAMLPIRAPDGTIVAFVGRAPGSAGPDVPKYVNSPGTGLYRKGEVLFGLWEGRDALARRAQPVIVEGPLDAIAVSAASRGRYVGVAPCGTALTSQQVAALGHAADLHATGVLVAFDPDQAGQRAAVHAYQLLSPHTGTVMAVNLPAGLDPAQLLRNQGPAALAHALRDRAQPLADLVIDAEVDGWSRWLQYAEGQINALRAAAPLIAAMPPAHVARQVARLADRLGLDYATVTEAVTDALPGALTGAADTRRPQPAAGKTTGPSTLADPGRGALPPATACKTTGRGATTEPAGRTRTQHGAGPAAPKAASEAGNQSQPFAARAASRDSPRTAQQAMRDAVTAEPPARPSPACASTASPARHLHR